MAAQPPLDLNDPVARHRALCEAFERVQGLPADARAAEMAQWATQAPGFAEALDAMLRAAGADALIAPAAGADPLAQAAEAVAGRGYRLLREIGRGGMGRVYLAERVDGRLTRRLAIKVLDRAMADPHWRQRFADETTILGRLVHPAIVRMLDAGEGADGTPFLVMEHVEGETLDAYLARTRPSLEARLALFDGVADAVAYAHQMLVAHRDLKPGNVLVDAEGRPHLLDFGIARTLSDDQATATGMRALTPRFASPEQVEGLPASAATDIYQLGALLYTMLVGSPPFAGLDGAALLSAIVKREPETPRMVAARAGVAHADGIDRELEAICLMALRKSPRDRYPSVEALRADLARWRAGEPVAAVRGGRAYRIRKALRRHWGALAAALLVLALVTGFIVQLRTELARTEEARRRGEQITAMMVDVIGQADPARAQGEELTLREALDQSVERLRAATPDDPGVRAALLEAVGTTYIGLSLNAKAVILLAEAADDFERAGDIAAQARALHARAVALQNLGNYAEAQAALESVLALRLDHGLEGDALDAEIHSTLGILHQYQRRFDLALAEFERALAILRAMPVIDEEQMQHTLRNLGDVRSAQGDLEGARAPLEEAWSIVQRIYGPNHPDAIRSLRALGRNAHRRGDLASARGYLEDGWSRAQAVYPPPHDVRCLLGHPLALLRFEQGEPAAASGLMRALAAECARVWPEDHRNLATLRTDLALLLLAVDDFSAARDAATAGAAGRRAAGEPEAVIAQPEYLLAVLDCLAKPTPDARAALASTWTAIESGPPLPAFLAAAYRTQGERCR